jgi:hypothetical protein
MWKMKHKGLGVCQVVKYLPRKGRALSSDLPVTPENPNKHIFLPYCSATIVINQGSIHAGTCFWVALLFFWSVYSALVPHSQFL